MMSVLKNERNIQVLDVTSGPMLKKMFVFAIPVILSGILITKISTKKTLRKNVNELKHLVLIFV